MYRKKFATNGIEILEQRIAPAAVVAAPVLNENGFRQATPGANLLHAGEGLTTGNGAGSGQYLLYVEAGTALVFTTDLNNNGKVDFNEITGIAAGDGLNLLSFADIHGDIVTNLTANNKLSDSDNNPNNNNPDLGGDGRVLLNTSIAKIELRSVTAADFAVTPLSDLNNDGAVDPSYVDQRLVLSTYSIYGNIIAGKSFGTGGGLVVDSSGFSLQKSNYTAGNTTPDFFLAAKPSIGSILTGTASNDQFFSFGTSRAEDIKGTFVPFVPPVGQAGGDIIGVKSADPSSSFNLNSLESGKGGIGARGGNIQDVQLNSDDAGGYRIIAGDGGSGPTGGAGGSIINFSDFGSVTGLVTIKTGNGGLASTGAGGPGGNATFGKLNLAAKFVVTLGNGGNGFTAGGNGASAPVGTITAPEGGVPFGLNVTGTATDLAKGTLPGPATDPNLEIGTHAPVDFNGDGIGDYVYTSSTPDQLVVVLGSPFLNVVEATGDQFAWGVDPLGKVIYNKIYLDGPNAASHVVVADFNHDGLQDIAVASNSDGNMAGVTVFLNKGNGADGKYQGFTLGRSSPLPSLQSGETIDPKFIAQNPALANYPLNFGYLRSANSVTNLVAGDFNGDGNTDLAVVATYYFGPKADPYQLLIFLNNDVEFGKPTATFAADFGIENSGNPLLPFALLAKAAKNTTVSEATVFQANTPNNHDVVFTGQIGGKVVFVYDNSAGFATLAGPTLRGDPLNPGYSLGKVDTNRNLPTATNPNISLTDATILDFTILDFGSGNPGQPGSPDGFADIAVLTQAPKGFVVSLIGDPSTPGNNLVPAASDPANGQNSGIFFGPPSTGVGGLDLGTTTVAIKSTDADSNGSVNDIAVLNYNPTDAPPLRYAVDMIGLTQGPVDNGLGAQIAANFYSFYTVPRDATIVAFDAFTPYLDSPIHIYGVAAPTKLPLDNHVVEFPVFPPIPVSATEVIVGSNVGVPLTENAVKISAGNGGNATIGKGGAGGFIGGALSSAPDPVTGLQVPSGAINITFPANPAYDGEAVISGGNGGNGFSSGGLGGGVSGTDVRYAPATTLLHSVVELKGGDGGFGVSAAGGNGGSLTKNSIQTGILFIAGNGGRGATGGNGGSVDGNGISQLYDSQDNAIEVHAGNGAPGVKKGGDGGVVSGFAAQFIGIPSSSSGELFYTGGNGGNAVSGPAGNGGGVTNSSPEAGLNLMAGEIYLQGGDGGIGTVGGAGGAVTNFADRPSSNDNPTVITVLGGNGGAGTIGSGGVGGGISNILTPSDGKPKSGTPVVSGYNYDRVIAGDGGSSSGSKGAAGGTITALNISSGSGTMVIAAGAGGAGLISGGAGGSVLQTTTNAGSVVVDPNNPQPGPKILVIAGVGGDALAFVQNPLDQPGLPPQRPFGGHIGIGGTGGSITGFTETTAVGARVDLIAGNGGSTLNYGSPADAFSLAGKGGSITNVSLAGDVGSGHAVDVTSPLLTPQQQLLANVPIKSYTDVNGDGKDDETVSQFIQSTFRLSPAAAQALNAGGPGVTPLDDNLGNVGIVVGAAGLTKAFELSPGVYHGLAAAGVVNGSLTNLTARNLMSAVAGDVNNIAAIQVASGIKIGSGAAPGIIGSDKDPTLPPFPQPPNSNAIADPTPGDIRDYLDGAGQGVVNPVLGGRLIDGALVAHVITGSLAGRVYQR